MRLLILTALAILAVSGCTTLNYASTDFEEGSDKAFFMTTGPAAFPARPVGLLEVEHTGAVIMGAIPISAGYLEDVKEEFIRQGLAAGANAAVNVEFEVYRPPFPLCVIWWVSYARIKGELVYIRDLATRVPPGRIAPPSKKANPKKTPAKEK